MNLQSLRVQIFADGADLPAIRQLAARPEVQGFTTNPTLMRQAGVVDYRSFALDVLEAVGARPVSFEVVSDDADEMVRQGREIASWGAQVYVKIPITNTRGEPCGAVIESLSGRGVAVNVTAITTVDQVRYVAAHLAPDMPAFVSVMAGRIADTGRDPLPMMRESVHLLAPRPRARLLWASTRELFNVFQADTAGCHIVTVTADILAKLSLVGRDLDDYSLETVKMFHRDALAAGYAVGEPVVRRDRE